MQPALAPALGPAVAPHRVLVVEDEPLLRRVILRLLEADDLRVEAVDGEASALAALTEDTTLVLCDFHLGGGLTSEALVRQLVAEGRRVVVTTSDPFGAEIALRGVAPVLRKPVDPDTVRRLCERG